MNLFKYLTNWKYRYFLAKKEGVEKTIEDLLFKRYKTFEIREEIRQEYDNRKSRLDIIKTQKSPQTEDQKVLLNKDIERFESQMKQLDMEIQGSKPTNDYPEGVQGINQQLDALRELVGMLNDYLKEI